MKGKKKRQKFFSFWNFCSLCRLFSLSLALSRFVLFAQFNRFVCARIPTAARTSFCSLSLKKALSHNRFTQFFFCQVCKILLSLSALALRCCSLSLCIALFGLFAHFYLRSLSLRFRRRAAMSCCCCSLTIWGGSLSELRRLRFVVFFHNRFICRIAVILLFRFLFGLCFCCCVGLAMLLLLLRCAAAAAAGACSTLPFAEEFHCNGPTTCAACSIMKKSLSAQTWQWQRRRRRHRRRRHINRTHNPIFYLTICCLSHFLFGFSACCAFAF